MRSFVLRSLLHFTLRYLKIQFHGLTDIWLLLPAYVALPGCLGDVPWGRFFIFRPPPLLFAYSRRKV